MEGVGERFRDLKYQAGFGNGFESEVLEGAIPKSKFVNIKPKIAPSSSNMASSLNSSQGLPSQSSAVKTRRCGSTK